MRNESDLPSSREPFSYSSIVRDRLAPKLQRGAEKGRLELTGDDCEKLLFVIRTSVPLEPFLEQFVNIIKSTCDDFRKVGDDDESQSG